MNTDKKINLNTIIQQSKKILITSHKLSDIDAVASCLLVKNLIIDNFGNKDIEIILEFPSYRGVERMKQFSIDKVKYVNSHIEINFNQYDTIFILDANELKRCFSNLTGDIKFDKQKVVVIDHHTEKSARFDLYINEYCSSTTEQIIKSFEEEFQNLKKALILSEESKKLALLGILADTQVFIYGTKVSEQTLKIYAKLIEEGAKITGEEVIKMLYGTTQNGQEITINLLQNLKFNNGQHNFAYSYINDELIDDPKFQKADISYSHYTFTDRYMTQIEGIDWGFVVHKIRKEGNQSVYNVSFRAVQFTYQVKELAVELGGGGHPYGAGALINGSSAEEVIETVLAKLEEIKRK